ncbi:TylF/MycF/NovP-related O-methyltransferase [Novosphingopyxis sp.]|uniref:TylF/MycF/NovP-related O-methyltransferase n=1 Tax=Novosphingopyxis sp. TaxID=2709690 RepID=UPI003B5B932C
MSLINRAILRSRKTANRYIASRFYKTFGAKYAKDGLVTKHGAEFAYEPRFVNAYNNAKRIGAWHGADIEWRAHVIAWAAEMGSKLDGDFVECGVDFGGTAMVALQFSGIANTERKFYLLDTFEGLDDRLINEAERARGLKSGTYPKSFDKVKSSFAPFKNVEIIQGAVPDTLMQVKAKKVAFLSIDMNCVAPEIAAGDFFWPKMVPGAPIILDDYGFSKHEEQRKAWDAFADARGLTVLSLPTGQGMLMKPSA